MMLQKIYFIVLMANMVDVNKSFSSIYPFYNSPIGTMVVSALQSLTLSVWNEDIRNCSNNFLIIGEVDFLKSVFPKGTVLYNNKDKKIFPFSDKSFSHVLVFNFLTDKAEEEQVMRELHRIVDDGGHIVIFAVKRNSFWTYDVTMPFKKSLQYTDNELRTLTSRSGFSDISFGKALLLPPALYRLDFAHKEQKFKHLLGWLAGITAVYATKKVYATPEILIDKVKNYSANKQVKQQTVVTMNNKD